MRSAVVVVDARGEELRQARCRSRRARPGRRSGRPTSSVAVSTMRRSTTGRLELGADGDDRLEEVLEVLRIDVDPGHRPMVTGDAYRVGCGPGPRRDAGRPACRSGNNGARDHPGVPPRRPRDRAPRPPRAARGRRALEVVGEAGTAAEAAAPDPGRAAPTWPCSTSGSPTATASRSAGRSATAPDIQCLMLTSYADDEALFDAIMAGAAGYVLKQIRGTDLVDAIRQVAAGQSLLDPRRHRPGAGPAAHRLRRRREAREPSPTRSAGSSTCWPRGSPTARSPSRCSWPRRRSRTTCRTSWPRWA